MSTKETQKVENIVQNSEEEIGINDLIMMTQNKDDEIRTIAVIGEINEEMNKDFIAALWYLRKTAKELVPTEPENPECNELIETVKPIEIVISTNGGSADDMFSMYDAMRLTREEVEIETLGLGKVMSAGTLILAAGTKGKRKIGKYCRIMLHSVIGGAGGPMHQLDNELKEIKYMQETYIKALCDETNLTEQKLHSILKRKVNVYLNAEEAVELGLADIIV